MIETIILTLVIGFLLFELIEHVVFPLSSKIIVHSSSFHHLLHGFEVISLQFRVAHLAIAPGGFDAAVT